jgi:nitroimidazol reductase NimA-like FMN-containing flavoprotein (pyridoxamine 5'-phosphate oxidase superfamily)
VLDAAPVCQVAFVEDGRPQLIPMLHWREGDRLYLHASRGSRMARALAAGAEACVAVTMLDGMVLARSAFHHSMNYRSVVVYGTFTEVLEPGARLAHLEAMFQRLLPGRWAQCRPPSDRELAMTMVLELPLDEAVAKFRSGPPMDDEADLRHPAWAGVLPVAPAWGPPVPVAGLAAGLDLPPELLSRLGIAAQD